MLYSQPFHYVTSTTCLRHVSKKFFHSALFGTSDSTLGVHSPQHQNDKQYHANKVYHLWRSKKRKEVYSNRLGIRYSVGYKSNYPSHIIHQGLWYMYTKILRDFQETLSYNLATAEKQSVHFERHCRCVFSHLLIQIRILYLLV